MKSKSSGALTAFSVGALLLACAEVTRRSMRIRLKRRMPTSKSILPITAPTDK